MNRHASLPVKLTEIRRDLHEFSQTGRISSAHRSLIDAAEKALDKVITEFELDGRRQWITLSPPEETGSH